MREVTEEGGRVCRERGSLYRWSESAAFIQEGEHVVRELEAADYSKPCQEKRLPITSLKAVCFLATFLRNY